MRKSRATPDAKKANGPGEGEKVSWCNHTAGNPKASVLSRASLHGDRHLHSGDPILSRPVAGLGVSLIASQQESWLGSIPEGVTNERPNETPTFPGLDRIMPCEVPKDTEMPVSRSFNPMA